jgi:hypothetical protein
MLLLLMLAHSLGCGTLLYPERRGQPVGKLDIWVVLLDSIGLVYFVVPGLVAFAVDFTTGAIYLPPGVTAPGELAVRELGQCLDPRTIEAALREGAGIEIAGRWREVVLLDCAARDGVSPLERLRELDAQARQGGSSFVGCAR